MRPCCAGKCRLVDALLDLLPADLKHSGVEFRTKHISVAVRSGEDHVRPYDPAKVSPSQAHRS